MPTGLYRKVRAGGVSLASSSNLFSPPGRVRAAKIISWMVNWTSMPKVTVNEHSNTPFGKYDVSSRLVGDNSMQSIPKPCSM
jgi:hypothetical protein